MKAATANSTAQATTGFRRLWAAARGFAGGSTARKGSLALADQAVVSATNFLTTVIVGRFAGMDELGVYSLGFTLVVLLNSVLDGLVGQPYVVFGNRLHGRARRRNAGSALIHAVVISVAAAGLLATVSWLMLSGANNALAQVIFVLAVTMPFMLLRELGRRMAFAHLRVDVAFAVDTLVALVQIGGLAALAWYGELNAVTATVTMGVACLVAGLAWLELQRREIQVNRRHVPLAAGRSWRFGQWLLASHVVFLIHGYFVHWLLAFAVDTAATGAYAACLTVVILSNPIIIGWGNFLGPKTAQAYNDAGAAALGSVVFRSSLLMLGLVGAYVAVLVVGGGGILTLFYGPELAGYHGLVVLLSLSVLFDSMGMPCTCGLLAMERTNANFRANLAGTVVTVCIACLMVFGFSFGVMGAAAGFVCGAITNSLLRVLALVKAIHNQASLEQRPSIEAAALPDLEAAQA